MKFLKLIAFTIFLVPIQGMADISASTGIASDYYFRGVSQSWHKPSLQGALDFSKDNFSAGVSFATISKNTYPGAEVEIDLYSSWTEQISKDTSISLGGIWYVYPGGSWSKYKTFSEPGIRQTPKGSSPNTFEVNAGVSYKYLAVKASVTLTDWFGANRDSGWSQSTAGSTYVEANVDFPYSEKFHLVTHIGRTDVNGMLNMSTDFRSIGGGSAPSSSITMKSNPDFWDYKVGGYYVASPSWTLHSYVVGGSNTQYWGSKGFNGMSFQGRDSSSDLNKTSLIFSITHTF